MATPFEGQLRPGLTRIEFDARSLPAGLYLYTLEGEGLSESGKMVLVR